MKTNKKKSDSELCQYGAICNFLLTYCSLAYGYQESLTEKTRFIITEYLHIIQSVTKPYAFDLSRIPRQSQSYVQLLFKDEINVAKSYLDFSEHLDFIAITTNSLAFFLQRKLMESSQFLILSNELNASQVLQLANSDEFCVSNWMKYFTQGMVSALTSFITLFQVLRYQSIEWIDLDLDRVASLLFRHLLPGDDHLLPRILKIISRDDNTPKIFTDTLFSYGTLQYSRQLFQLDGEKWPSTLIVELNGEYSKLPATPTKLYKLASDFANEKKPMSQDHLLSWLNFLSNLELSSHGIFSKMERSEKISALMYVFFLTSPTEEYLFRELEVEILMKRILKTLVDQDRKSPIIFKEPKFLSLYLRLIDQFNSVSFGNVVLGTYLLLPCSMANNADFRVSFWTELENYVRLFTQKESDIPFLDWLCTPKEIDKALLHRFKRTIAMKLVTPERAPVLWKMIQSHML